MVSKLQVWRLDAAGLGRECHSLHTQSREGTNNATYYKICCQTHNMPDVRPASCNFSHTSECLAVASDIIGLYGIPPETGAVPLQILVFSAKAPARTPPATAGCRPCEVIFWGDRYRRIPPTPLNMACMMEGMLLLGYSQIPRNACVCVERSTGSTGYRWILPENASSAHEIERGYRRIPRDTAGNPFVSYGDFCTDTARSWHVFCVPETSGYRRMPPAHGLFLFSLCQKQRDTARYRRRRWTWLAPWRETPLGYRRIPRNACFLVERSTDTTGYRRIPLHRVVARGL